MTRKIRKLLLALFVGAVLVVFVLLVFTPNKPMPLPNPNGCDAFLKAGQLLVTGVNFSDATNLDQLQAVLSANTNSLRLVKLGLSRECRISIGYFDAKGNPSFGSLASVASFKTLAQMLDANHRLAELEGRTNDAITSCVDAIKFGNEISRGGVMIDRRVGIACENIGYQSLAKAAPTLNLEDSRRLIPEIEAVDARQVPWAEVCRNENAFMRKSLRHYPSFNPILLIQDLWSAHSNRKEAEVSDAQIHARLRLLTVELALRCFRQEHGKVPAKLDELVPAYLKAVPQDPFSGKPLVYRTQGTNWLLYSVGPDGMDNGGVHQGRGKSLLGTDLFYEYP